MSALDNLLKLKEATLTVGKDINGNIYVHYTGAEVKDGAMLIGACGRGVNIEAACEDYLQQITGKLLVFDAYGNRKEVFVL